MITTSGLRAATMVGALVCAAFAHAAELPSFRAGLWSFTSTVSLQGATKPQERTVRLCTNPTDDIQKKWDTLSMQSCKFSPVTHTGNQYSYNSMCEKNGILLQARSVITVESSNAYRVETQSKTNSQARKEVIVAKREGACSKSGT